MANWYYAVGGQTQGPVDEQQVRAMARQGTLTPTSYVVREGETVWVSLGDVEASLGLARNPWGRYADAGAAPPPAAAPSPAVPSEPYGAATAGGPSQAGTAQGWVEPGASPARAPWEWGGQPGPSSTGAPGGWADPGAAGPSWSQPTSAPPTWSSGPGWGSPGAQPYPGAQWGATPGPGFGPNGERLAEWWQRLVAKLIDSIIVAIPGLILFAAVAWSQIQDELDEGDSTFQVTFGGRAIAGQFLWAMVGLLYFALLNARGQTLGKMMLGIKTVRADNGAPIGVGKGFARHAIQFVAGFLSCLGLVFTVLDSLWPLWDKSQRQALHDKLASTIVVKAR